MDARHALLANLFDYAGVFPPAELPLDEAVAEWKRIQASDDAWLANRFVVRTGQETEVDVGPLAIVDGPREIHDDLVYVEGETKLRCGGARVPSVEEVAAFIRRGAPFKATAGLHHARSTDGEHGFLNLLAACLWPDDAEELLTARDITVDSGAFRAAGHCAEAPMCAHVRLGALQSIGSCSFDEPVGELKALGIL